MSTNTVSAERLLAEARAIARRFPNEARLLPPSVGRPTFEATFDVAGQPRHVRMTLPPGYPSLPPEVREITAPGGSAVPPMGLPYRLADGILCLFPHGNDPQGWRHERLAVEALERCIELLKRDHDAPTRRLAFTLRNRLFVSAGAAQLLRIPRGAGALTLRRAGDDWFVETITADGHDQPVSGLKTCWSAVMQPAGEALWLRLSLDGAPWSDVLQDSGSLRTLMRDLLPAPLAVRAERAELLVLIRDETDEIDAVAIRRPPDHVGALHVTNVEVADPEGVLFHRTDGVIPDRTLLGEVQIILVGLGSLGGAVALALARAGCRRFVLVDPDRLAIDNVSRHIGTIQQLGWPKVEVVAAAIKAVNPSAEVETHDDWLAWDMPGWGAGRAFEQVLDRPHRSIVVTTCAVGSAERQINALVVPLGVPAVYASVLGAAEHGRIFRVLPQASACYECVRIAQRRAPDLFPQYVAEHIAVDLPYVQPSLPGLAIDIGQIALITARLTLQTIARVYGLDLGFADESGDHLLWTNRGGWGFDRPLQIEVVRVPRATNCGVCATVAPAAPLTSDEEEELQRLFTSPRPLGGDGSSPLGTA